MRKTILLALLAVATTGCMTLQNRIDRIRFGDNPYVEPPFYARYLSPDRELDRHIEAYLIALREDPDNPVYHNELGRLLIDKGFPNDAEREFRRALVADPDFYPAWYNLALVQAAQGNETAALRALDETLDRKPGHASALFQKGLLLEQRGRREGAIRAYVEAFRINYDLLRPSINPQIIDSRLIDQALLALYPDEHQRRAMFLQPTPPELLPEPEAPSDIATPEEIVPPAEAAPVTAPDPSQSAAPPPPSR
ncbi:MAG: tetratricopeptide repeat protein [Thermoanaerobaculia bacterium]